MDGSTGNPRRKPIPVWKKLDTGASQIPDLNLIKNLQQDLKIAFYQCSLCDMSPKKNEHPAVQS